MQTIWFEETLVKTYETEKDVQMNVGETVTIGPYSFQFEGVSTGRRENYEYARGQFEVSRNGHLVRSMSPEKRKANPPAKMATPSQGCRPGVGVGAARCGRRSLVMGG